MGSSELLVKVDAQILEKILCYQFYVAIARSSRRADRSLSGGYYQYSDRDWADFNDVSAARQGTL